MLRRSGRLFLALGFAAVSMMLMAWFDSMSADRAEALRVTRSDLQTLEQQINLLKTPDIQKTLEVLEEDMDSLRIRLVEVLTQLPQPASVLSVEYEHAVLSQALEDTDSDTIKVLRLELRMIVQHAMGFLEMLTRIDEAIPVWPHDVQACMIHRTTQEHLQVACALDFYHWNSGQQQASTALTDGSESAAGLVS